MVRHRADDQRCPEHREKALTLGVLYRRGCSVPSSDLPELAIAIDASIKNSLGGNVSGVVVGTSIGSIIGSNILDTRLAEKGSRYRTGTLRALPADQVYPVVAWPTKTRVPYLHKISPRTLIQ